MGTPEEMKRNHACVNLQVPASFLKMESRIENDTWLLKTPSEKSLQREMGHAAVEAIASED